MPVRTEAMPPTARRPRRRLRLLLAAVALLGLALATVVRLGWLDDLVRSRLVRASAAAGLDLRVADLRVHLLPPSATLESLQISRPGDPEPLLEAELVELSLASAALLRGELVLGHLTVHRPVVRIPLPGGERHAGRVREGSGAGPTTGWTGRLARVQVIDGVVLLPSGSRPIGLEARGVQMEALSGPEGLELRFLAEKVHARLRSGEEWSGAAAGRGVLEEDGLRLDQLRLRSPETSLALEGYLGLDGSYRAGGSGQVDAEVLARLRPDLPPLVGRVELDINITGAGRDLRASGRLTAEQLQVAGVVVQDLHAKVSWDGSRLSATEVTTQALGGRVAAAYEAELSGGTLRSRLTAAPEGVDPVRLADALGLDLPPWNTRMDGTLELRWSGADLTSLRGSAEMSLRPGPDATGAPIGGIVALQLVGDRVRIPSARLEVPGTSFRLTGLLERRRGELAFTGTTAEAGSLVDRYVAPLTARLAPEVALPDLSSLDGAVNLEGRLEYGGGEVTGEMMVRGEDVRWAELPLGQVRGHVQLEPDLVRLIGVEIDGPEGTLGGDAEVLLGTGRRSRLEVRTRLTEVEVGSWITRVSGRTAPVSGRARGVMRVVRHGCGLEGRASISMPEATLLDRPATDLRAEIVLTPGRVQLLDAVLSYGGGTLRGSGTIALDERGEMDLRFAALGLRPESLHARGAVPFLAGQVDMEGRLHGPASELELEARVEYRGPEEPLAPDLGTATLELGGPLERLEVKGSAPDHHLDLLGHIGLGSGLPVELNLRATELDLSLLQEVLGLPWDEERFHGRTDLHAAVFGPLESPEQVRAEARITELHLDLDGYQLHNDGPMSFGWSEGVAVLRPSRVVGDGTDLELRGRIDRGGTGNLESSASGTFDLRLLEAIDPGLHLQGTGRAQMEVETREGELVYGGTITVDGGRVAHAGLPVVMTDVRASAEFRGPLLTLTDLQAEVGGGAVSGSGSIRFEGLRPAGVELDLQGRNVRVTYPSDLETVGDFRLSLRDRADGYLLSGRLDVARGIYRLPLGGEASGLVSRPAAPIPSSLEQGGMDERLRLDLAIEAPHSLFVRSAEVNLEASGSLRVGGTLATPQVSGRIDALEGGLVRFRDVRYRVVGGYVDFAEYGSFDPYLHLDAITNVRDYEIILALDGRLSDLTFELTSYPRLNQDEILVLLVTGRTPQEIAERGGQQVVGQEMAAALSAPLGSNVARALGLTQVRIEPVDLSGNARLTLIKEAGPKVRVTFSDDFQTAGNQIYRVEYDVTPKQELLAVRDENGGVGGDFRYTTRGYSFPRPPELARADDRRVGAVVLEGAPPELEKKLRKQIRLREGKPYRRSLMLDSLDRLRATLSRKGHLEGEVTVDEEEHAEAVDVVFRVTAGPHYELRVDGAPHERKLRRRLKEAFERNLLAAELLREGQETIEGFYLGRGYPEPKVTARQEEPGPDQRVLRFDVEPGPRVRVGSVSLEGNETFDDDRLRRLLATDSGWLRKPVLEEDRDALLLFYRQKGFQEVQVFPPEVEMDRESGRANVTIRIDEGTSWRIAKVAFEGNRVFSDEQLLDGIELAPGDPVTRAGLDAARTELRLRYDSVGHDEARVSYRVEGDGSERSIVFLLEEGPHHRVGSISVRGGTYTKKKVIWRELDLDEGDNLSRDALLQAQRRLGRLGIFRTVDVDATAEPGQEEVPVVIEVHEAPNILTSVAAGWDTESGPRGSVQIRDNNFLGRDQTVGGVIAASAIAQRVRFSYLEPRLFGRHIEGLLSAAWSFEDQVSFDERRIAASVGGTRRVRAYQYLAGYVLEDVNLSNIQVLTLDDRIEDVRLGSVFGTVIRDLRNDSFNPTQGMYYSLDMRVFGAYLGSDENFLKFYGRLSYYHPVTARSFWAQGLRIGMIDPFAGSHVPINERFFAGGDSTIRGFPRDTVGPLDPTTQSPTGGNAMLILNEEYHFPIWGSLEGVVFLDLGNVYPTIDSISVGEVRKVFGAGLHYRTPLGPIRLEYGHKLDRRENESAGELYFSIGIAF